MSSEPAKLPIGGYFGRQDLNNTEHGAHIVVGCNTVLRIAETYDSQKPTGCPLFGMFAQLAKIERADSNFKTSVLQLYATELFKGATLVSNTAKHFKENPAEGLLLDYYIKELQKTTDATCKFCQIMKKLAAAY